ncbi:Tyrosine-protein kinase [Heracleum sosnowskyi]|uniref:Tyrosine-protein kinase n=1 Tax=Heracleum sosnowskyi TaxID=360622 RepID=A0AAD8HUX1_9APIA|nr:Tyrosine-protein kinase [Heracleum sosnowskyi]
MKPREWYTDPHNLNLLSHGWVLYQEGKCLELLDLAVMGSYDQSELFRAIHVGLLCVQPRPEDRPSMSMVVSMLSSDIELPHPKDPRCNPYELSMNDFSQNSLSTSSVLIPRIVKPEKAEAFEVKEARFRGVGD